jgi:hypothetical protein
MRRHSNGGIVCAIYANDQLAYKVTTPAGTWHRCPACRFLMCNPGPALALRVPVGWRRPLLLCVPVISC